MRVRRSYLPLAGLAGLVGLGALPCHWSVAQAQSQGQAPLEVRVSLAEWSLSPTQISVPVGRTIRFVAHNAGVLPHALVVQGAGVYAESATIGSGGTVPFEVSFSQPGLYDVFCPVNAGEHRALGQEGLLSVLPSTSSLGLPATGESDPDDAESVEAVPLPDLAPDTQSTV